MQYLTNSGVVVSMVKYTIPNTTLQIGGSVVKVLFVLKESNALQPYFGVKRFFFRAYITLIQSTDNTRVMIESFGLHYMDDVLFPRKGYGVWSVYGY